MSDGAAGKGLSPSARDDVRSSAGEVLFDLAHLSRQTMGDRALESEILMLFSRQMEAVQSSVEAQGKAERLRMAHGLKGTARGVGAVAIADCAAAIEDAPDDAGPVSRLLRLIDESRAFISAISR